MIDFKLNEIKRELEKMRCEKCNQHPAITINRGVITATTCCESFKTKLDAETRRLMPKEVDKAVRKTVDDMFRKFKR